LGEILFLTGIIDFSVVPCHRLEVVILVLKEDSEAVGRVKGSFETFQGLTSFCAGSRRVTTSHFGDDGEAVGLVMHLHVRDFGKHMCTNVHVNGVVERGGDGRRDELGAFNQVVIVCK
jgi:hypothetical protein